MKNKQYTLGKVTYGYSLQSKKWEFKINDFSFLCSVKGTDSKMKQSIARIVEAGYIRSKENGIGGLARANIENILAKCAVN